MKRIYFSILFLGFSCCVFSQGLKIQAGTNLVVSNSVKIVLSENANLVNNGTFLHGNGEVLFTGNVDQEISGSSVSVFYDLNIDKIAGELDVNSDFDVMNELQMNAGQLDLQNGSVDLGTTGSIVNESEANRIKVGDVINNTGTIRATRNINNVTDYNPANLGVLISTDVNMGNVTLVRGHKVLAGSGSFSGNNSVARYYEVPNIGELDANDQVKLHYWQAELNGHNEAELKQYQWVEEGPTSAWWTPLTGSVDMAANLVSPSMNPYGSYFDPPNWYAFNFTELFTLGSKDIPLPVELIAFNAYCHGEFVSLEWETASEKNNEFFILEKSETTSDFIEIGRLEGAGTCESQSSYRFLDTEPLGIAYYRLKQVDYDGTFTYSELIVAECLEKKDPLVMVYPNPFRSDLHVVLDDLPSEQVTIEIFTIEGKLVHQYKLSVPLEGLHKILSLQSLKPSMYIIRLTSEDWVKNLRVEKM